MQKLLDSKKFDTTILKILLLYLSTSAIFLGIIFFVMYERGLHTLRTQQLIQMRNEYINIITHLSEEQDLNKAIATLKDKVNLPFALIDEDNHVLFSNLSINAESIPKSTRQDNGFYRQGDLIFIDLWQNRSIEYMLTHPPFNFTKRPKAIFKHFEKLKMRVILQGVMIGGFRFEAFKNKMEESKPSAPQSFIWQTSTLQSSTSIQDELFSLRVGIIASLLFCLMLVGVIAYFLVKLALKPLHDKFNTLERFIKDSTHEINTPLSVILLSVQKFDTHNLSESNLKKMTHIKLAAQNLNHLYQNLIFFNFYQSNPQTQNIDLKALISQRINYFNPLLAQKSITLESRLSDAQILANPDEIQILIDNLLSNAIKYNNKQGQIFITLQKGFLEVRDNGYGISKQNLESIFTRYSRFNNNQGGFGIGLSLVREICERYDIDITCQSEEGHGSCFVLKWK